MSKKKTILFAVIALVLGLAIGVGATLGLTAGNQTGTVTAAESGKYSIDTDNGTTTVTIYNWSHVNDVEIRGESAWYLYPRSVCNYLKETYEIWVCNEDDGPYVSSHKEIESKDTDSDFDEYYNYSDIVSNVNVDEDNDTLTFTFATAQTELSFNVYTLEKVEPLSKEDLEILEVLPTEDLDLATSSN